MPVLRTVKWASPESHPEADGPRVVAVGREPDLAGDEGRVEAVVCYGVSVGVAGQHLQREDECGDERRPEIKGTCGLLHAWPVHGAGAARVSDDLNTLTDAKKIISWSSQELNLLCAQSSPIEFVFVYMATPDRKHW